MSSDDLIVQLLDVAADHEADVLDDLLVRCGYWWECAHGYVRAGGACDECGATNKEE